MLNLKQCSCIDIFVLGWSKIRNFLVKVSKWKYFDLEKIILSTWKITGEVTYLPVDDLTAGIDSYGRNVNAALLHTVSSELTAV